MNVQTRRKLPINPEEVRTLMEDLGIDEDVARGMIAVRLGFTDNVIALPLNGFERSPAAGRMKRADVAGSRGKGTRATTAPSSTKNL